jgi:flagellar biosynthesis GTPase FlhF
VELKRIVSTDTRSAIALATDRYGKDALIVSNERINGRIEIVVAVDDDKPMGEDRMASTRRSVAGSGAVDAVPRARPVGVEAGGVEAPGGSRLAPATAESMTTPAPVAEQAVGGAIERERAHARELVSLIRDELTELRREFRLSRQVDAWQTAQGLAPEVRDVADALLRMGVPAGLRGLLVDQVRGFESRAAALAAIDGCLRAAIAPPGPSRPLEGVHLLAGPAGAGKSLMIARLAAAHASARAFQDRGVAVVSFRDQRPGAWSQMQILSAQVGVECFRATNGEMMQSLLQELSQRRLVLIDTPGSPIEGPISELRAIAPDARIHLVLPLDATPFNVQRHVHMTGVRWDGLMIARMDEAANPWPLLQVLCERELPVSFGGFGPELADLIEASDPDLLVGRAMENLAAALASPDGNISNG